MFRRRKFRLMAALALAAVLCAVALVVSGTSSPSALVKLTPVMVSADTSKLPPDAAKAEMSAVWRMFDRDTSTAYMPTQTSQVTVSLSGPTAISRIRVYGASSYQMNVYRDNNGAWESVPALSGVSLSSLNAGSWNSVSAPEPVTSAYVLFEFIPQGSITAGVPEIELWGPEALTGSESPSRLTLNGLSSAQDALSIISAAPSHILELAASPSELPISNASSTSVSVSLTQNPVLFKRAYLMYDGYNLPRAVSVSRRINNLSWSGGFAIPVPDGTAPSWTTFIEEINPGWLVQGVNTIDFKSPAASAVIRNCKLLIETDSGWNSVSSVSPSTLYDGDLTTSYTVIASSSNPVVEITFERPVQPETIRLNVAGPMSVKAGLQYQSGDSWQDVQGGAQIDLSTMQAGWNDISVPAAVSTTGLRLVFATDTLAPDTVVGSINEIRVSASPSGPISNTPRIVVSYPRDGEYFGRTAYMQGFVLPAVITSGSAGSVFVEVKNGPNTTDGSFSLSLTKDETRFYTQADDETWEPVIVSEYAGQYGAYQYLLLNKNAGQSGSTTNTAGGDTDTREKYTDKVSPGQAKKIQYKGVTLDIPAGAVDQDTEITIIPLTGADLARLDPGMVNVTYPDAGYRFLPHGMKFKKQIKISFGYSKQLFAAGQVDDDVQMFFYNEKFLHWEKLGRNKVDKALSIVESNSDHFTDIINSTLVVPEHPQALSFNPNSLKDIKAADPSANIDLIEPPRATSTGNANLNYPIEIPKGRGAYTPDLRITYSSSNANGWMGLGWDIPVSKIQVDTRWGVPRYDLEKETESYLLDGASLAPHAPRPFVPESLPARSTGDKVFRKRIEGDFQRIIRKKTSPREIVADDAYYWEITNKNGTKFIYGQTSQARLSSYGADKNIFQWNLEKVIDSNGNVTQFFYDTDSGSNGEPFKQIYLKKITYTKSKTDSDTADGPYVIEFQRSASRPDVISDGKPGFQVLTQSRLERVDIKYKKTDTIIRQYVFTYVSDSEAAEYHFGKSLLQKIAVRGLGAAKEFYNHEFTYERMQKDSQMSNGYVGFKLDSIKEWKSASTGEGLSHTKDFTKTITLSPAIGPTPNIPDFGFNGSYAKGDSTTLTMFMDVNGDGLPDRLRSGGGVELNTLNADRESGSFTAGQFNGIGGKKLAFSEQDNFSIGAYIGYWIAAAKFGYSTNFVNGKQLMSDVDGDGLVDHLEVGGGLQVRRNTGTGFESPVTWNGYTFDNVDFDNGAISDRLKGDFYLSDPVRKWVAPYKGQVRVKGEVRKVKAGGKDDSYDASNPDAKASVRAYIYKNNDSTPLWHAEIPANETTLSYPHDITLSVVPGDRVYFRTNSIQDSDDDDVLWQPEVTYEQVCVSSGGTEQCVTPDSGQYQLTDTQSRPLFTFDSGGDLRLSGFPGNIWNAAAKGKVRIFGTIKKKKTSDDVQFKIKFNDSVIWTESAPADFEGEFTHELVQDVMPGDYDSKYPGDRVKFDVEADTTMDADLVQWRPEIVYQEYCFEKPGTNPKEYSCGPLVCALDENNVVQCTVQGVNLSPDARIEEKDIHIYGQPNYPHYYVTPTELSRFWVAPYDGKVRFRGDVIRTVQGSKTTYVMTAKTVAVARGVNKLLWKEWMPEATVPPSGLFPPQTVVQKFPHDFTISVSKGDQIFFDIQVQNFPYDPAQFEWTPSITYSEYCFNDSTGQKVCKVLTEEKTDTDISEKYCDSYDDDNDGNVDRTVCTSTTCPLGVGPESGTCNYCVETTYQSDPSSPQQQCEPISCTSNPIEGTKNCLPLSFIYKGRSANVSYKDQRYYYDELPDSLKPSVTAEAFGGGYRFWHYGDWNGNVDWDESKIKRSKKEDVPSEDTFKEDDAKNTPSYFFVYTVPRWQGVPGIETPAWRGRGENTYIASGQLSSSRLGKNVTAIIGGMSGGPAATISTVQQSVSDTKTYGVSLGPGSVGKSTGDSKSKLDFMDMNGDRFPDQVSRSSVLFNNGAGGFYTKPYAIAVGDVRKIANENRDESLSFSRTTVEQNSKGYTKKVVTPGPSLGLVYGSSDTNSELIDINGDGLPDRVSRAGSDGFLVQLNLGYRFSDPIIWQTGSWGISDISNDPLSSLSINPDALQVTENATYSLAGSYWNIGGGASYTIVRNLVALRDVNGDGLADQIFKPTDDHKGDFFYVRLNRGNGFGPIEKWEVKGWGRSVADDNIANWLPGGNDAISYSATESYYISGGLVIPIPIIPILTVAWIDISTSVSISGGSGGSSLELQDINGDGLPDHVLKLKDDDAMYVRLNNVGQTNLLKKVKRPLGGSFTIDYKREGNTVDMPQSQWVMKQVVLADGMGNTYRTDYAYSGGYHDRYERDFYGFRTVTETQAPNTAIQRTVTETFHTGKDEYYRKGLLEKTITTDNTGHVWAKTSNTFTLTPIQDYAFASFPALTRTDTYFYDGSNTSEGAANKSTYQTFAYDSYGNVTKFFDAGEATSSDNVIATMTYFADTSAYIVGKPLTIVVTDATGTQYRSRSATYEPGTGNLLTLTMYNTTGPSVWTMTYYTNGNLFTITDPVGYKLEYSYDDDVATYVTKILDNFVGGGGPYYSTATYNPLFGRVRTSTDLNNNVQANGYDEFGRLACIYGPYDAAPTEPDTCSGTRTIAFTYVSPVINSELNTPNSGLIISPASAITENRAVSVKGSDPIIIKTITYVDGMKRIIHTKKDADVNVNGTAVYGMTVSGKVVFDDLGRVAQKGQPVFETGYNPNFTNYITAKNPTLFTYDPLDRTTMVKAPDAKASGGYAITTTTYDFAQVSLTSPIYARTTVIDPIGNSPEGTGFKGRKESYKDVADRIMAVVEYNNGVKITTTYEYDPLGQITSVWDEKKNHTLIVYDQLGRRTIIDNPDTGKTEYGYDANGNLISKLTANYQKGKEITYTYAFNRLKSINYPFSTQVKYDYGAMGEGDNRAGRIKKVTDESGIEERYYGKLGETLKEEKTPTGAKTQPVQNMKFTTQYVFDSFGRMTDLTYPDGEALHYAYDNGGLLKAAWGTKNGTRYDYITSLLYDEYGQRTHIEYGNGTKTDYTYDDKTRRLATLGTALLDSRTIQNLSYDYSLVGNVKNLTNDILVATNTALPAGPVKQSFGYDDLYQLTSASGSYAFGPGKQNNYTNAFMYDTIGNMTYKKQTHTIVQPNTTSEHLPKETNYVLNYAYGSSRPHAVIDDGTKLYTYDAAGNMTGWDNKRNGTRRTIIWNEENRVKEIDNNGQKTYFLYDDAGERVIKRGQHGETVYVNRFYSIRNGELGTKHVFAGEIRVLSKLVKTPSTNTSNTTGTKTTNTTTPIEKDQFYYHGDHMGSSNMITDAYGAIYQHLEYFPYGESWIEEGGSYGGNTPGYKFTGKELDPETGLYYYGARYYDPVLSKWISADPLLDKYLPPGNKDRDQSLPGMGGVFNPKNLNLFHYAGLNPLTIIDPDGMADVKITIAGTPNGRFAYTWAYPHGDSTAYRTALYNIRVSSTNDKGVTTSVNFEGVRFGPRNVNGKLSVAGLAEEQTHHLTWYPGYKLHSSETAENGAWIVYGNYLIHDGGDGPRDLVGTAGCVEIYGPQGFSKFNEAILKLSGEKSLKDVNATVHYEKARRPTIKEFPTVKFEDLPEYTPPD